MSACLRTVLCTKRSPGSAVKLFPLIRLVSVATTALLSQIFDPLVQLMRHRQPFVGVVASGISPRRYGKIWASTQFVVFPSELAKTPVATQDRIVPHAHSIFKVCVV